MTAGLSSAGHEGGLSLCLTVQNAGDLCAIYGVGVLSVVGLELARRFNLLRDGIEGGLVEILKEGGLAIHAIEVEEVLSPAAFAVRVLLALCAEPIEVDGNRVVVTLAAEIQGERNCQRRGVPNPSTINNLTSISSQRELASLQFDMRHAAAFQGAICMGGVCSLVQPIAASERGGPTLFYECHIYVGGVGESNDLMSAAKVMPTLRRLNMSRYVDVVSVGEAIMRLQESPSLVLACAISIASAVCDAWWHSVFVKIASDYQLARRLIFSIPDLAGVGDVAAAVAFTKTLKLYGCKVAIGYPGSAVGGMAFLVAARPDILTIDAGAFARGAPQRALAETEGQDESQIDIAQAIDIARHLAPFVVLAGVEAKSCWEELREMGAEWFQGGHIGVSSLFARPGRTDCLLNDGYDNAADTDCRWHAMMDRVAVAGGATRITGAAR